jgi:hypothetical protein
MKLGNHIDGQSIARGINFVDPTAAQDVATKAYVDGAVEGLNWKDSVRVHVGANVNLAGPGASLDGITMAVNDRFSAFNQTVTTENGIYIYNGAAVAATRAPDMNAAAEFEQAVFTVEEGTSAGSTFRQTLINFTLGSGSPAVVAFGNSAPAASESTAGIAELATQGEADTGTDDTRTITPLKMANWSGRKRKSTATIGDGSATSFNIDHNFNMRDVVVEVYESSGNYETIIPTVQRPTVNRVTLVFSVAPGAASRNVVIIG